MAQLIKNGLAATDSLENPRTGRRRIAGNRCPARRRRHFPARRLAGAQGRNRLPRRPSACCCSRLTASRTWPATSPRFNVIAVNFPKFVDGRGYSTAALLRQRYGYTGELRAVGDVLHDQLFFMRRCRLRQLRPEGRQEPAPSSCAAGFKPLHRAPTRAPPTKPNPISAAAP